MVRDGWVLGATVLIYVFFCLRTVSAQQPGRYYTGAGGTSNSCGSAPCPTCVPNYQYNLGCTGASSGTCTNCTNAQVGYYYSGNGGQSNLCSTTACSCSNGYYNPTCANATSGTCIPLPNTPGFYYTSTTNWVTITQLPITSCTPPAYNVGSSSTNPGACTGNCTLNAQSCLAGQYLSGCGGTSAGTCQTCQNTPPTGQEWTTNGGVNPYGCGNSSCLYSCNAGYYISGCSLSPPNPQCVACINSPTPNVTYFRSGPWYSSTCPVTSCTPNCLTGQYLFGCGSAANPGSPGTCVSCTN